MEISKDCRDYLREYFEGWENPDLKEMVAEAYMDASRVQLNEDIDNACRCYCDNICEKGMCCMCMFKHDGEGQVKKNFGYRECNDLQIFRREMKNKNKNQNE